MYPQVDISVEDEDTELIFDDNQHSSHVHFEKERKAERLQRQTQHVGVHWPSVLKTCVLWTVLLLFLLRHHAFENSSTAASAPQQQQPCLAQGNPVVQPASQIVGEEKEPSPVLLFRITNASKVASLIDGEWVKRASLQPTYSVTAKEIDDGDGGEGEEEGQTHWGWSSNEGWSDRVNLTTCFATRRILYYGDSWMREHYRSVVRLLYPELAR